MSEDSSADDPVQRQVEAYNARDLDAFLACYADDVVIRTGDGTVLTDSRDGMAKHYGPMFEANPDLHGDIVTRIRVGEWTVDEERVRRNNSEIHAVVAYLVRDGLIRSVVMIT